MTKPIERNGYIDMWVCIKQGTDGRFFLDTTQPTVFGNGFFMTELDAQHHQTICLLKNERVQVFKLEYPL